MAVLLGSSVVIARADPLERHLWQDRLLILIAAERTELRDLDAALERERAGVIDRRLTVYRLLANRGMRADEPLDPRLLGELRRRFGATPDTRALILIGLDGGIKRRNGLDTPLAAVFAQIDAMPMRADELRRRPACQTGAGAEPPR